MDGVEPADTHTSMNDEESERTMLLGRGDIQQQYKGKHSALQCVSQSNHEKKIHFKIIDNSKRSLCLLFVLFVQKQKISFSFFIMRHHDCD